MDAEFFLRRLYPLQDEVLRTIGAIDTEFYLTGGTAAPRGYLHHRFSEDLDLFANDATDFPLWCARAVDALAATATWNVSVTTREPRFVRLVISVRDLDLKVELVNDVPSHIGTVKTHPALGRLDTAENILANKLTALADRDEPKDVADVWTFCCIMGLPLAAALTDASSKAAGLFPADLARRLLSTTEADWRLVRWQSRPSLETYLSDLRTLGERLLLLPPPA